MPRQTVNSQADMRGFNYALAPYLRKQEWLYERLQNQLAQRNRELATAREMLEALQEQLELQAKSLQDLMHTRPSPEVHKQGMAYIARLRKQISEKDTEVQVLLQERNQAQTQCVTQQLKLDGLHDHREQEQASYAAQAMRLAAAEADRDWMGRAYQRTPDQPVNPAEKEVA